jgi:hypothetical protein
MIELDTFELDELAKQKNLPESLRGKIFEAVKMNAMGKNGIVFFSGNTSEKKAKKENREI